MSEEKIGSVASNGSAKEQPTRKEPKQISFRVSDEEYVKLQQSAELLHMSVAAYVKKKAQGSRLVVPKFDKETRQSIARDLSQLGNNMNQIAKYCHTHQKKFIDWERLNDNIKQVRKELNDLWQRLN